MRACHRNYNFIAVKQAAAMKSAYALRLANPKEFYHEAHRPTHFLDFSALEAPEVVADKEPDREDLFT